MISIHYKPLMGLSPSHLAILAICEQENHINLIAELLAIPLVLTENNIGDLVIWSLVIRTGNSVSLTPRANLCVQVLKDTNMSGFWSLDSPKNWILGKGYFSLDLKTKTLSDAGFDGETRAALTTTNAKNNLKESIIANQILTDTLDRVYWKNTMAEYYSKNKPIQYLISKTVRLAKSHKQLDGVYKFLQDALDQFSSGNSDKQKWVEKCQNTLDEHKADRKLHFEAGQANRIKDMSVQVLLSKWLTQQQGVLKQVAATTPSSILIKSGFEDITWTKPQPTPAKTNTYTFTPKSNKPTTSSFFDRALKSITSFFD